MTERLSNERLADLEYVARVGNAHEEVLEGDCVIDGQELRALVDEVRERRAHECPEIPVHVKSREPRHTRPFK